MGGAGRKSPACVEIASLLRNTKLFALEPAGWLFAMSCWLCAEQKVVCVLVASGQKKRQGKKKKEELIFLEACVVEMSLEEKREISFLLLSEGAGRGG